MDGEKDADRRGGFPLEGRRRGETGGKGEEEGQGQASTHGNELPRLGPALK